MFATDRDRTQHSDAVHIECRPYTIEDLAQFGWRAARAVFQGLETLGDNPELFP